MTDEVKSRKHLVSKVCVVLEVDAEGKYTDSYQLITDMDQMMNMMTDADFVKTHRIIIIDTKKELMK